MTLDPELVGLIHDYILGNEPGITDLIVARWKARSAG
jgi:hypothetical protein